MDWAVLHELWERAPALLGRLPPPYRQVATLQGVLGWSRSAITDWLCAWRPIARQICPGILRRTHEMLPFLVGPVSPRERWPRRTDPKKNPWIVTPPRFRVYRVEAAWISSGVGETRATQRVQYGGSP